MKAERIFIDTNIIIYLYSKDEPHKKKKAESLFLGSKPLISIQVLNETANVCLRKVHFDSTTVRNILDELERYCKIAPITIFSVRLALQIREKYRFSYFDSLIAASAYEHGCSVIFTEDLQHDQLIDGQIRIINPFL